ncbi:Hypothetical protein CINCED_3A008046 [Cinara cedri]|uniref:Uncharacterized protein n=1 Tax=Cinara cedri TaxID=506608 RepID=A0A5E4MYQ0_9HEMI|nr:Hypothetical protein CINCED_3A008046 [Cinara cedri]
MNIALENKPVIKNTIGIVLADDSSIPKYLKTVYDKSVHTLDENDWDILYTEMTQYTNTKPEDVNENTLYQDITINHKTMMCHTAYTVEPTTVDDSKIIAGPSHIDSVDIVANDDARDECPDTLIILIARSETIISVPTAATDVNNKNILIRKEEQIRYESRLSSIWPGPCRMSAVVDKEIIMMEKITSHREGSRYYGIKGSDVDKDHVGMS